MTKALFQAYLDACEVLGQQRKVLEQLREEEQQSRLRGTISISRQIQLRALESSIEKLKSKCDLAWKVLLLERQENFVDDYFKQKKSVL